MFSNLKGKILADLSFKVSFRYFIKKFFIVGNLIKIILPSLIVFNVKCSNFSEK